MAKDDISVHTCHTRVIGHEKTTTIAVRLPQEIRQLLEEKVVSEGFSSLTQLVREILTEVALDPPIRNSERTEACKQQDNILGHDKMPLTLNSARTTLCTHCPYREQRINKTEEG